MTDRAPSKSLTRPEAIAEHLRERVLAAGLRPGDRLPQQWLEDEQTRGSRGTLREAMKILQTEGLIRNRTGPGGGSFIATPDTRLAIRLLNNLFLFDSPGIADIYALRRLLEPELAADVAGRLDEAALARLRNTIRLYEDEPVDAAQEYAQRLAELDFHAELASHASNPLLGFACTFCVSLLQDKTECREIYAGSTPGLRESGLDYQVRLLRAIKAGNAATARTIMAEHMREAEAYMCERAVLTTRRHANAPQASRRPRQAARK